MSFTYVRFLLGSLCGFLAGHMLNFGLVQWAQEVLHAPAWSGAFFLLSFGLPIVFGWHGGVLCDRVHPLRIARRGHLVFLLAALVIALGSAVLWLRREQLAFAWLAAFITGIGWSYASAARLAAIPRLVPPERLRSSAIVFNVASTVGFGGAPLLVGLIRTSAPWPMVFLFAGGLILLSFVCFFRLPLRAADNAGAATEAGTRASPAATFAEGFAYIRRTPVVAQLLIASSMAHLLMGPINVLLPRFLDDTLGMGPAARGAFLGLAAPALIAGGLAALRFKGIVRPGKTLTVGIVVSSLSCAALGALASAPLAVALFFFACMAAGFSVALLAASLQEHSELEQRGRVMATYAITTQFFPAFSGLACGVLLSALEAPAALRTVSIAITVLAVVLLLRARALTTFSRSAP